MSVVKVVVLLIQGVMAIGPPPSTTLPVELSAKLVPSL